MGNVFLANVTEVKFAQGLGWFGGMVQREVGFGDCATGMCRKNADRSDH